MNAKPLHTLRTYCLQYSKQFGPGGLRPYSPSAFARPSKQKTARLETMDIVSPKC